MTDPRAKSAPSATILEIYQTAVEMADRTSSRRATANSFFLTLQTGLVAALAALATGEGASVGRNQFVLTLAGYSGIVLAAAWWLLLRSYRDLSRAKFAVITRIERDYLPVHPFDDEWSVLKRDPVKRFRPRYAELGLVERIVPIAFGVVYLIIAVHLS